MRGARGVVAVGLVAGVAAVAVGLGAGANADVEPEQAVRQAAERMSELPSSVTIDGPGEDGELTVSRTPAGAGLTASSPQGTIEAALRDDALYVRVDGAELPQQLTLLGALPAFEALLGGQWVSLDVSQDSEVLAALRAAGAAGDPAQLQAAGEQLQASLRSIGEDLREPMSQALQNNTGVVKDDDHYRVTLDSATASAAMQPALRAAFDEALAAMDAFVAQLPDASMWQERRADLVAAAERGLTEPRDTVTLDVWLAGGRFSKIVADDVTLTFDDDASVDAPSDAVPLDQDLLTVLTFLPAS